MKHNFETTGQAEAHVNNENNEQTEKPKGISRREFSKTFGVIAVGAMLGLNPFKEAEAGDKAKNEKERTAKAQLEEIRRDLHNQAHEQNVQNKPADGSKGEREINLDAKRTIDECLAAYNELARRKDIWPPELFTDDFVIALQAQESKGDPKAVSPAGALGIMQVMPATIKEVHNYLNLQRSKNGLKYNGPEELSDKQRKDIEKLILTKSDYGRAYGKIYLMRLFDDRLGFKIGNEEHKKGQIEEAQRNLLAAYNAGPGGVSKIKNGRREMKWQIFWPSETKKYWKRVFEYKNVIARCKEIFKANGLSLSRAEENFAANIIINKNKIDPAKVNDKYLKRKALSLAEKRREHAKNNSNFDLKQILMALS